ncbi:hypothetical protein CCYA_CCYA05G1514 [Cyanidiococcus yangmingshanensis]|nr:hypothetical protein CCYA_CCYA05G1514 [Cyanidiococcus yangmingshanensis]
MRPADPGVCLLQGHIQTYAWGRRGQRSRVARYAAAQGIIPEQQMSDALPYAELWLGTHPSGEASVITEGHGRIPLSSYLPAGALPFLLKVLSVDRALSIQAHPDNELAKILNARHPHLYRDANHKPEMCVCLGPEPFEALFGFRPVEQIVDALKSIPEFRLACGSFAAEFCESPAAPDALRKLFESFMHNNLESLEQAKRLRKRLESADKLDADSALALRLSNQYPNDAGVFAAFLLNHVRLEPGEAIFVGPNEPHAYLQGDCVEIMATSDNVVRAGLTEKHKDIETLCSMLVYASKDPVEVIRRDAQNRFPAPVDEFQLECIDMEPKRETQTMVLEPSISYSILLVVDGEVTVFRNGTSHNYILSSGMACLVAPGIQIHLQSGGSGCVVFRASVPAARDANGL